MPHPEGADVPVPEPDDQDDNFASVPVPESDDDSMMGAMLAQSFAGIRYFGASFVVWFLEICAGSATLTQAVRAAGVTTLDPVGSLWGFDLTKRSCVSRLKASTREWRPPTNACHPPRVELLSQ